MKRLIALTLLFTSFANLTSCNAKYQVNEQEFWDAISMKNVQYLQYSYTGKTNAKIEIAPNISHTIDVSDQGTLNQECYVKYIKGPMDDDASYEELIRHEPSEPFKKGGYPTQDYYSPEIVGQDLVGMLEEQSITFQHFTFKDNIYSYSFAKIQFKDKKIMWFDTSGAVDVDNAQFDYQKKDIIMPEPGDK